jgi:hypothetical protein
MNRAKLNTEQWEQQSAVHGAGAACCSGTKRQGYPNSVSNILFTLRRCSVHAFATSARLSACFLLFTLITFAAQAQTVTLQGFISDGSTGQALAGANVILYIDGEEEMFRGTATDPNGFYSITGIPQGRYDLRISYLGYLTHEETLDLDDDRRTTLSLDLMPDVEQLEDLVVTVRGGAVRPSVGRQQVRPVDLARVPTPAGSGDLVSYLQTQPGVVTSGDRGGQLFIRGGTPSQNMVLMDGILVYQPFHIVGFFSAFPQDLVAGADVYAGGFGPQHSGRISSVIDVRMREGNQYNYDGSGSVSPFAAEIMAEGPLKEGESSWIAFTRHSLIEHTSPVFLSEKQPLKFQNYFFKTSHTQDNLRCSALAMRTYDRGRVDFDLDDSIRWSNFVVGGRCLSLPSGQASLLDINMYVSRISNTMTSGASSLFSSATRLTIDGNIFQTYRDVEFRYGGFINVKFLNYDMQELFRASQLQDEMIAGSGVYMDTAIPLARRLRIQPGFVFTIYPNFYTPSFEPRLRAEWQPFGREEESLSFATGIYRQPVVGINDIRDVSSVFTGWMTSPEQGPQKQAIHAMAGWMQTLGGGFSWSAEGFYKRISNQPVTVWNTDARFNTNLALAKGDVYGGDIRVEYSSRSFFGYIGYGYTFTEYISAQDHFTDWFGDPLQRFHPPHDRRHQINTNLSLNIGSYTASMGWQFGTGLPYTRPLGFDERLDFSDGLPSVRAHYGNPRMIIEKPYQGRLPLYHRMDLSLERVFSLAGGRVRTQAGAINMYNHANIFFYDVHTHRRVDQLPFAPYLSLKLELR